LEFFILFSSVAAIRGIAGQGDYTAANAYLDAYAPYRNKKRRGSLSINWPAWKETGMAVDYHVNQDGMFQALSTAKALQGFEMVYQKDLGSILVGIANRGRCFGGLDLTVEVIGEAQSKNDRPEHAMIAIQGKDNEQYSNIERRVATIWAQTLGLRNIAIYDSFNQLGGNSLLAVKLFKELELEFSCYLDITDIYSYPTISAMAEYLASQTSEPEPDELDVLLDKLTKGELTESQIEILLET
ncbi:acyl carrier protein, partial [Lacrimispora brassicae]